MERGMNTPTPRQMLTDDLERQLMQEAIERQFRPQPLRALRRAFGDFLNMLDDVAQLMGAARARNFQTQAL